MAVTLIERRQFSRHRVDIQATANWELGDQTFSVQLNDLSAEGFCIQGSQSGGIGQRVLLRLAKPDGSLVTAAGKAKWQLKIDQDYLVGCELTNNNDYAKLREFASIPDAEQREQDQTTANQVGRLLCGQTTSQRKPQDADCDRRCARVLHDGSFAKNPAHRLIRGRIRGF